MPNPLRKKAGGLELYCVFVNVWADDVSGNVLKQYNKHYNFYMTNASAPGRLLQREYFVHFVSTSPHANSLEQFAAVSCQIKCAMFNLFEFSDLSCYKSENRSSREDPVTAYNAATHKLCKFMINAAGLPADNPQQSDECSHIGLKENCNCR